MAHPLLYHLTGTKMHKQTDCSEGCKPGTITTLKKYFNKVSTLLKHLWVSDFDNNL